MKAVILAGGLGERLKPFTLIIPKPLLPVGEKSVLEIIIQKLKEQGIKEIIIATNYQSHLFESYFGDGSRFGVKIKFSKETKSLGTAGPLSLIKHELSEPFLLMNGDILTNINVGELNEFHVKHGAHITMVTKMMKLHLDYGVIEKEGNKVKSLTEKPVVESEICAGVYLMDPSVLDIIPADSKLDMPDLLRQVILQGKKVVAYPLVGYWLDMGQTDSYQKAQEDAKNGLI